MKRSRQVQFAAFAFVTAAYVAIRLWRLTDSCLWFDEIFSVHAAEHSWNTLLSFVTFDLIHPPLFYILLKLWITAGGEGLFWLRLFPGMFAIISIVPFVLFLRELKLNRWIKIFALFLLAVNGSLIKYAQEVRMYSPLLCLSLFSMWLFARYFARGKSFIPLVFVNLLLIYTHYFGWLVVFSELTAVLFFQRIKWRRMVLMFAFLIACFVPWIYAVLNAANSGFELGQNIGWMTRPKPLEIFQFLLDLIEPIYYQAINVDPASVYRVSLPIFIVFAAAIGLYLAKWNQHISVEKQRIKLLALFVALPLIIAFVMSWLLPYSIWGTRHLIIVFIPFFIILATMLCDLSNAKLKAAALTLIVLLSGYAFAQELGRLQPRYSWCEWQPLTIEASKLSDAPVYTFEDVVAYNTWFAGRNRPVSNQVLRVAGIPDISEDKAYFLPRGFDGVELVELTNITATRFWIAYRAATIDESKQPLKSFIEGGFRISRSNVNPADHESAIFVLLEKDG